MLAATRRSLERPVGDVVVTTGVGFRGWMAAAEGWGLSSDLGDHLAGARLLTRGPKARGAVRAAGLNDHWTPATESCAEVKDYLLAQDLRGRRIAVQQHGEPLTDFVADLRGAGAEVIVIPVYRWLPYRDPSPLRRLITQTVSGSVDAVAFTSAPAVHAMLNAARAEGAEDALLAAFAGPVVAACVGPVTAGPLADRGVPTLQPDRARLGALARVLARHLPAQSVTRLEAGGHRLEIRGHAVVVDGELRPLPPAPMAVLKRLADKPGHVVSRADLRTVLPGSAVRGLGRARGRDGGHPPAPRARAEPGSSRPWSSAATGSPAGTRARGDPDARPGRSRHPQRGGGAHPVRAGRSRPRGPAPPPRRARVPGDQRAAAV
ncbi:uroporphyrinogen-III synthase [Nonomuraea ferruginea]